MRATKSLFLKSDGQTVVEEGDPEAHSLLVAKGCEIADDQAKKYGVTFDEAEKPKAKAEKDADADDDKGVVVKAPAKAQDEPKAQPHAHGKK